MSEVAVKPIRRQPGQIEHSGAHAPNPTGPRAERRAPAGRLGKSDDGAARRLKSDSRATYSISVNSGSMKPQRLTKLTMSVSDTVRSERGTWRRSRAARKSGPGRS